MVRLQKRITIDVTQPSKYQPPEIGTWKDGARSLKLFLAYRHYRRLLRRYTALRRKGTIVEVGCGPGYLIRLLEGWYPEYVIAGLDYDPRLLENARERAQFAGIVRGNAEILPFGDEELDALIALHLIEHLFRPESFINEARRTLKPGGILLIATPNLNGIGARVMGNTWGGYSEDHVSLRPPKEWATLFRACGLEVTVEKTTALSGIPVFRQFPLAVINWGLLVLFGAFSWKHGESYCAICRKVADT